MKLKNIVMVSNAVFNCSDQSGASNDYCEGMIVGVVSGLMAFGMEFDDALAIVKREMPKHTRGNLLPESWQGD